MKKKIVKNYKLLKYLINITEMKFSKIQQNKSKKYSI